MITANSVFLLEMALYREQGWHSGAPCGGRHHKWVEFSCCWCSPCSKGFSPGSPVSSSLQCKKTNTSKFHAFDLETVDEEPLRGKISLQIPIYLCNSKNTKRILSNLHHHHNNNNNNNNFIIVSQEKSGWGRNPLH